uniref:urea transporter n=1 Tax=Staphylococcus epidermidis TaxID=1282 RepID=UPI001643631A
SGIALGVSFARAIHSYVGMILGIVVSGLIDLGLSRLVGGVGLGGLTWGFIFGRWIMLFGGIKNECV